MEEWAEEHDVVPVREPSNERHEPDLGLQSRDRTDEERHLDWDQFHEEVDRHDFAMVRAGEGSESYDIVRRGEAAERADLDTEEVEDKLLEGETVTSEIAETRVIEAEVTETVEHEIVDRETVDSAVVTRKLVDHGDLALGEVETGTIETAGETATSSAAESATMDSSPVPTGDEPGATVVDTEGREIGTITDVEGDTMYVDPHASPTERVMAALNWGDHDEEDFPAPPEMVEDIDRDRDRVVLSVERDEEFQEEH